MSKAAADTKRSVTAKLKTKGGQAASEGLWNISLGGVFAEVQDPLGFGDEVACEFHLPTEPRILRCKGFVVWSSRTAPDKAMGKTGVALRLTDIRIAEMRHLSDNIGRLL